MHLLIDLDGTLTDPRIGIITSVQHALRELGEEVPPAVALHWCIGPPLKDAFVALLGPDNLALVARAVRLFRERFGTVGLFENEVYPEVPDTLSRLLESGHTLHLATSKPQVFAERIMGHFNLATPFTSLNGSELDGTRSDKSDLIAHILASHAIAPETAIMIGDRKHDMIGAVNNRLLCIGALWGYGSQEELTAAGAAVCLECPSDLPSALEKLCSVAL
jgi:phosphoglycolate phosphatase